MGPINLKEARARLSDLVQAAEHGESTTITRRGKAVARIVPFERTAAGDRAPDLTMFRASLKVKGKVLSQVVLENRRKARF
jgi:prevent-host-death family protein